MGKFYKGFAIYQFIFGILGIIQFIYNITNGFLKYPLVFVIVIIIIYIFSIIAGVLLFFNLKIGKISSLINQFLQIFQFNIFGLSFAYSSGFHVGLGFIPFGDHNIWSFSRRIFTYNISSNCHFLYLAGNNTFYIGINFIAVIFVLIFINSLRVKKVEYDEEEYIECPFCNHSNWIVYTNCENCGKEIALVEENNDIRE